LEVIEREKLGGDGPVGGMGSEVGRWRLDGLGEGASSWRMAWERWRWWGDRSANGGEAVALAGSSSALVTGCYWKTTRFGESSAGRGVGGVLMVATVVQITAWVRGR